MTTHLQLWADWIGALSGPGRIAVAVLVIALVAVLLGAAFVAIDHVLTTLMHTRIRLQFKEAPASERQHLAAVVHIADRRGR